MNGVMISLKKSPVYQKIRKTYKKLSFSKTNESIDAEMKAISTSLSSRHLANCKVYPNRKEMLAEFPKNSVVAEIGVAAGDFSADILSQTSPTRFFLVDAWAMDFQSNYGETGFEKVTNRFNKDIAAGVVTICRGYSHQKLDEFDDDYFDWVYIDADHGYNAVKSDLELSFRKVKQGGIIAGHDYLRWGDRGVRFGVLEAVNEFCVNRHLTFLGISLENNLNWSYALKVDKG